MSRSWQTGTFVKVKCCTEVRLRWEFLNACSQFVYTFLQTSREFANAALVYSAHWNEFQARFSVSRCYFSGSLGFCQNERAVLLFCFAIGPTKATVWSCPVCALLRMPDWRGARGLGSLFWGMTLCLAELLGSIIRQSQLHLLLFEKASIRFYVLSAEITKNLLLISVLNA